MSKISIQPSQMRAKASALESLRQQHLNLMRQMRVLVNNLNEIWQGEAQEAFVSGFNEKSKSMSELASTLEKYIEVVNSAADEIERVDNTLLGRVKSI